MLLFVVKGSEKPLRRDLDVLGGAIDDFGEPDGQTVEFRQAARHVVVARFVGDQVVEAAAGKRGNVFRQGLAGLHIVQGAVHVVAELGPVGGAGDEHGVFAAQVLRGETLLNLVYSVVTGAMYDEFQQRVYLEPELSEERLLDIFREVYESYGFEIYDGYEYEWADVIHNFQQPLYYISYAVSAIPALELYVQSVESPNEAMDTYLRVAGMSDEEYYLTDALRETGLSNSMKSPIGDVIAQELEKSGAFDFENG